MVARSPASARQSLLLGAWDHRGACVTGEPVPGTLDLGPSASLDLPAAWLEWFDRWLMDRPGARQTWPAVRFFAMGANRWREADAWPPSDALEQRWYLHGDGRIAAELPRSSSDRTYRYDPDDPTPALSALVADPLPEWSARDIGFLDQREDVLVYTSDPFAEAVEIAGPVVATLRAASTAVDTDFAVILADVAPDGGSALLSHGILRAAFRDSLERPEPLVPGQQYRFVIEANDLGHTYLPGHRLRVVVCSALFPYYHPNPNTGALYGDETDRAPATQTVCHDPEDPSFVTVWVRPGDVH
jgi:putative CocE/NonD family hydrolase